MSKGRTKSNIKFNFEKLDNDIKRIEGENYSQVRIDKFVLGRSSGYYRMCRKNGEINNDVLNRVCEYYNLDKDDYIGKAVEPEPKKESNVDQSMQQNYENIIIMLAGFDKTMKELLTQLKTTNFLLNELKTSAMNDNKFNKEIVEKLDQINGKGKPYYKKY